MTTPSLETDYAILSDLHLSEGKDPLTQRVSRLENFHADRPFQTLSAEPSDPGQADEQALDPHLQRRHDGFHQGHIHSGFSPVAAGTPLPKPHEGKVWTGHLPG